ncbi:MAG: substrate-binding domain-containing protein [Longicatena sp.]
MKKIIAFVLTILLLLGCSSKNAPNTNTNLPYFLFAIPLKGHPVWEEAQKGFEQACSDFKINCNTIGPGSIDIQAMNNIVETAIIQKADGIITQGIIDPSLIQKANVQDIPIVLVDSDMKNSGRNAYMGKDFHEQAVLLFNKIEKVYGKDKKLNISIQVADASFDIAKQQIQEIENVFKNHNGGFEIINISESKSDQIRARQEWMEVFTSYNDINVSINFAGESAESCFETAKALNLRDNMLIFGVDDVNTTLKLIKNGSIDGSIVTSFYNYGYKSVERLYDLHNNKTKYNPIIPAKLLLVDKYNVDTYKDEMKL